MATLIVGEKYWFRDDRGYFVFEVYDQDAQKAVGKWHVDGGVYGWFMMGPLEKCEMASEPVTEDGIRKQPQVGDIWSSGGNLCTIEEWENYPDCWFVNGGGMCLQIPKSRNFREWYSFVSRPEVNTLPASV